MWLESVFAAVVVGWMDDRTIGFGLQYDDLVVHAGCVSSMD